MRTGVTTHTSLNQAAKEKMQQCPQESRKYFSVLTFKFTENIQFFKVYLLK